MSISRISSLPLAPLGIPMLLMSIKTGLKWNGVLGTQPKMAGHELRRIFLVAFNCPHCGIENDGAAAWVIEHEKLRCQNTLCGREIDLSGADWIAFRKGLNEALANVQPLYDKVPN
jgi:hypothetical protein